MAHPATPAPIRPAPFPPNPLAPEVAEKLASILGTLMALIAHHFLRNPRFVHHIGPLWTRLNRARQRFARLMDHVAAGTRPRPHSPRDSRPGRPANPPRARFPQGHAWLASALTHHGYGIASQLQTLLTSPGVPELLATAPTARRILNPLRHILGLSPPRPRKPRPKKPPEPQTETRREAQHPPPRSRFDLPRKSTPRLNPSAAPPHAGTASGSSTRRGTSLSPPRRTPPAG